MGTVPSEDTVTAGTTATAAYANKNIRDAVNWFVTSRPVCLARQTVLQAVATATWTSVTLDSESVDRDGGHSTVTNTSRYTSATAGWYYASGVVGFAANATGFRATRWAINGTDVPGSYNFTQPWTGAASVTAVGMLVFLNSGDYLELQCEHNIAGSLNTNVTSNQGSSMSLWWIGS
jgi:hypothetical protein